MNNLIKKLIEIAIRKRTVDAVIIVEDFVDRRKNKDRRSFKERRMRYALEKFYERRKSEDR